jgi:hypothetical protein
MMTDLRKTVEALLVLRDGNLIDDDTFAAMTVKAVRGDEPVAPPEPQPRREHRRYPQRENFHYKGIKVPSGASVMALLFLAEHAGTAFTAMSIRRGLKLPADTATQSTVHSAMTTLKSKGLVHHETPNWWISDLGMEVAAAWQASH